ncbi:MAG: PelD GGDEF domain-containing protein [Hylemonella sp.]
MRDTLRQLLRRYGLNRWLAPQPQEGGWTQASEILAIPALAAALAWLLSPADPLLTQAQFPWIWFAPVLVALRYGVTPGLTSCVPLVALWYAAEQAGRVPADFGLEYFFGGGLLVLICGEYSDVWRDRNARMDETNVYLAERLSRITKRHLLLNLSHDRLEHEMLSRPTSLRDALVRLRALTLQEDGRQPLPGAGQLLQLLAQYVNLQSAALYTAQADGPQRWALGPEVARLGEPVPLRTDDELYELAQREQQLAHIAQQDLSLERSSEQLIVAPLLTSDGTPIGVLSVSRIPFFALHVENLQMLSVILSYYADLVQGGAGLRRLLAQLPTMPPQFAEELVRMQGLQARTGMASQILVMRFPQELGRTLPAEFARIKRGLDVYWQTTIGHDTAIVVLMPLANAAGMAGFMQRIQHWLQQRLRDPARVQSVQLQPIDFATDDPVAALQRVLQQG